MPEHSFGRANQKFTVADWRHLFGAEPGIVGDVNGSAYNLSLPTGTDNAVLGSSTQDSRSVVGGALHLIAQGQTQTVTIPASTNAGNGRTDIIAVRYDPATFTTDPGPCRLVRIAGVEGSTALPTLDEGPPGVEDMPLWAVTRKQGQSLNQAAVRDLRRRQGPNLLVPAGEALPVNVPLGTRAARGNEVFRRAMNSSGTSVWVLESTSGAPAFAQIARTSALGQDTSAGTWGFYGVGTVATAGEGPATHFSTVPSTAASSSKASITFRTQGVYAVSATIQLGCSEAVRARLTAASTGQQGTRGLIDEHEANAGLISLEVSDTRFFSAGGKWEPTFQTNKGVRVQSWSMWATRLS